MPTLLEFLRKINIRASIALDEPLARHTSFGIGGPADALVEPTDPADFALLVSEAREEGIPLTILGGGANVLVSDKGLRGIVVTTRGLRGIEFQDAGGGFARLRAGSGAAVSAILEVLLARGLGTARRKEAAPGEGRSLADFYGMPGSLGGSVFMNARCYDIEMADVLESVDYVDRGGREGRLEPEPGEWAYKDSPFRPGRRLAGAAIVGASFMLAPADRIGTRERMLGRRRDRETKGHYRLPSAGSMFKNDRALGRPTGAILDELGFRGRRIGDAMVSPWHANIFVNAGRATARDMLALVDLARTEVRERLGAAIEAEVLFLGER